MLLYFFANSCHISVYHEINNRRTRACNEECVQTKTYPKFNICLYENSEDIYISVSIRSQGLWDNDLTLKIHAALTLYPNATFIDIGANIGYFALYACTLSKNVVAIEAVSRNAKMVYKGLSLNTCKGNVIVLNNAISNGRTRVSMQENRGNNMGGLAVSKEELAVHVERSPSNLTWVEAITIDDILPYVGSNDVVTLDIEGYECKALESSVKFFQVKTVHYIFMEWLFVRDRIQQPNASCPLEAAQNMVARLAAMGFIPSEYNPKQKLLDIKQVASWDSNDIVWRHKDVVPV
ncbi:hypothetical protein ACJMK2_006551 [Sinanodonta woodiana]